MSLSPVRIQNAHKYYNRGKDTELHVMNDVCLELPESGMVAIFGRSGCGKTTLLNAVGGLDRIASGTIEIFGRNIREDADTLRNKYIGYIFQNYNLNVNETVFENVSTALRLCGMEDEEEIAARTMTALGNVEMDKYRDRTPDTLSGGQQQRVAIARALVKNPSIILADEPTGNLDEQNTILVMDILKSLSKTRLVLLVTHEANLVDHYCDRVIEIVDGRVTSDRENLTANGYISRNKNHIYLGELEKTETATPGVLLEYYGEPTEGITIRVVNQNGKLYVKLNDPTVKILDEGSEIKLLDGVFVEAAAAEEKITASRELDMSRFAPFEGKSFGRLFHMKNSLRYAWRENFRRGKKKGKGLLRACLVLLAIVMVFMTASFGASIRSYADMRKDHNERLYYVPLDPTVDLSALNEMAGKHGVDYARIVGYSPIYETEYLEFRSSTFMSAENVYLSGEARPIALSLAKDMPLVAGTAEVEADSDIVITSALARKLLDTSTVSFLREPADLIDMVTTGLYYYLGNIRLRIVGVVESDELFFFVNDLLMARYVLQGYFHMPLGYSSYADISVNDGEIVLLNDGYSDFKDRKVGDTVTILGKSFVISRIQDLYNSIHEYPAFVKETYGVDLITDPSVYAREVLGLEEVDEMAEYMWLLDYYFEYIPAFYEQVLDSRPSYAEITFEEWLVATHENVGAYAMLMGYDYERVVGFHLYNLKYESYPTVGELESFMAGPEYKHAMDVMMEDPLLYREYNHYMDRHYGNSNRFEYLAVISDRDYMALSSCVGATDDWIVYSRGELFSHFEYGDGTHYYTNHLMLRSSDPDATEAFLTEALGRDGFLTPDDIFDQLFDMIRSGVVLAIISVLVVLALMCLCTYFIMRSSFMSRVREVGILRAIGVTRRNLTFRFAVETGLLLLLTTVLGYVLSVWFIASLSDAVLFSTVFYFPLWMAVGLLAVIALVGMFFGILPAMLLLRRTPSEILSKYDI